MVHIGDKIILFLIIIVKIHIRESIELWAIVYALLPPVTVHLGYTFHSNYLSNSLNDHNTSFKYKSVTLIFKTIKKS